MDGVLSLLRGNKEELSMIQDTFNAIYSSAVITKPPTTSAPTVQDKGTKGDVLSL